LPPAFVSAQLTTDQVPLQRTVPADVEVRAELERSRLQLGPVRVLPWLSVPNFGYNNNIFGSSQNPVGDWVATVGAGARFYLPIASKTFLRLDALPQYTWYKDFSSRNQWGGRGEAAYLAFFNRLSLQLSGTYSVNGTTILSSEVPALVVQTGWDGKGNVEVDVTRRISIFAGAEVLQGRVKDPGELLINHVRVANYDRTDGVARAGVRYSFSPSWNISIAAEGTETLFVLTPELRNNRSVAPLLGLHYDRPRFFANIYAGYRIGQPLGGSAFPAFQTPTGSGFLSYVLTRSVELSAFGWRRLVYGSSASDPYYIETRYGGGVTLQVLSTLSLNGYGNYGTNDYSFATSGSAGTPARLNRVGTYGGTLSLGMWRSLTLRAGANQTIYYSNVPGNDRSVFIFTTGLSFGAEYSR
jgi:hypothetical protein